MTQSVIAERSTTLRRRDALTFGLIGRPVGVMSGSVALRDPAGADTAGVTLQDVLSATGSGGSVLDLFDVKEGIDLTGWGITDTQGLFGRPEQGAPTTLAGQIARESANRTHDGGAVLGPRPGWMVKLTTGGLTCAALLAPIPMQMPWIGSVGSNWRHQHEAPRAPEHADAVEALQRAGLTLSQLERLLGVTRQTVNNWRTGKAIDRLHLETLLAVRDIVERALHRYPSRDDLAAWLVRPRGADGVTPLAAMEAGDFDRARYLAISTPSRVRPIQSLRGRAKPALRARNEERMVAERPGLDDVLAGLHSDDDGDDGEEDV